MTGYRRSSQVKRKAKEHTLETGKSRKPCWRNMFIVLAGSIHPCNRAALLAQV